jgi:hypothetical protein
MSFLAASADRWYWGIGGRPGCIKRTRFRGCGGRSRFGADGVEFDVFLTKDDNA